MKEFIDKLMEKIVNTPTKCLDIYSISCPDIITGIKNGIEYGCASRQNEIIDIVNELAEEYNKKQEHEVWLNGCDDDTIFTMEMTNNEYEFLKRVSELANETSTYHCMPRLFLDEGVGVEYAPPYTEGE